MGRTQQQTMTTGSLARRKEEKAKTMRKLALITGLATLLVGARSHAAPAGLACPDKNARNCFQDEIFLLDGNEMVDRAGTPTPLVIVSPSSTWRG